MSHDLPAAIVIPVLNRRNLIGKAIRAALEQSHPDCIVIAVDDGSADGTWQAMGEFAGHPQLALIRLAKNTGTGPAKNMGIMLAGTRAVTFHDSDDRPHPDKLLRQARALGRTGLRPDPCLNWDILDRPATGRMELGAVFAHHDLILPDGRQVTIRRDISIIDDVFPNIQMGDRVPGDWLHVNSGLFHPRIFAQLGGYADSIEEDREFRNRIVLSGQLVWIIEEPLLTKIETADSLTQSEASGYLSPARTAARAKVWQGVAEWMATRRIPPQPIDLDPATVAEVVNPGILSLSGALASPRTRRGLAGLIGQAADQTRTNSPFSAS